jgi:endogenous inhibitor of DNA gyrase (YacG/DUF329 family)
MDAASPPKTRPCPICGKKPEPSFSPFCSARCKTIDLGRWLDGRYGVPSDEPPEGDEGQS